MRGQLFVEAMKTLADMMECLLLSSRNFKTSTKGLSGFQFDLKECKSMTVVHVCYSSSENVSFSSDQSLCSCLLLRSQVSKTEKRKP